MHYLLILLEIFKRNEIHDSLNLSIEETPLILNL